MYEVFGISEEIEKLSTEVENELKKYYEKVDNICKTNSIKVLDA